MTCISHISHQERTRGNGRINGTRMSPEWKSGDRLGFKGTALITSRPPRAGPASAELSAGNSIRTASLSVLRGRADSGPPDTLTETQSSARRASPPTEAQAGERPSPSPAASHPVVLDPDFLNELDYPKGKVMNQFGGLLQVASPYCRT